MYRIFIKQSRCLQIHCHTAFCIPASNYFAEKMARQRQSNVQYGSLCHFVMLVY